MKLIFKTLFCLSIFSWIDGYTDLQCSCGVGYNATMTAYFPDYETGETRDVTDVRGKKLRTLQDYIDGRAEYVTAAMDRYLNLSYGTSVCIPELNLHFRRPINIQVRDTDPELDHMGVSRIDVCVRSEADSFDTTVNRRIQLIIET